MTSQPKPIASLTSGLLARKGRAQPAMRRQVFDPRDFSAPGSDAAYEPQDHDDLGWNDMGEADPVYGDQTSPPSSAPHAPTTPEPIHADVVLPDAPAVPPVHVAQAALAAALAPEEPARPLAVARRARQTALSRQRKAAFTLRLDDERHLRLRLLSAVEHRSAQQIVSAALDEYIARHPDLEPLVAQARRAPDGSI